MHLDPVTLTFILRSSDIDKFSCKNLQTLHSVCPPYPYSACTLTLWPWPIFYAPVTLINFASTLAISSTIVIRTFKPCIVFLLDILTQQAPWSSDLDLYFICIDGVPTALSPSRWDNALHGILVCWEGCKISNHHDKTFSWGFFLTLVLLNKLRCRTLFKFSASQITWSRLLI